MFSSKYKWANHALLGLGLVIVTFFAISYIGYLKQNGKFIFQGNETFITMQKKAANYDNVVNALEVSKKRVSDLEVSSEIASGIKAHSDQMDSLLLKNARLEATLAAEARNYDEVTGLMKDYNVLTAERSHQTVTTLGSVLQTQADNPPYAVMRKPNSQRPIINVPVTVVRDTASVEE